MGILCETESFLTACISLVHEPAKPSYTNSPKELRRNSSPIGHNNTKHFLCPVGSRHLFEFLEIARWKSVRRGSFTRTWKLSSRPFSRPDWLPRGLRGCAISGLRPVHTYPFSFQNATFSLRIRLPSTPIRWKRSMKTELFQNALQNGTFLKALFSHVRVDRRKRNFSKWLSADYRFQSTPRNTETYSR